jgi:hypothetical protein
MLRKMTEFIETTRFRKLFPSSLCIVNTRIKQNPAYNLTHLDRFVFCCRQVLLCRLVRSKATTETLSPNGS